MKTRDDARVDTRVGAWLSGTRESGLGRCVKARVLAASSLLALLSVCACGGEGVADPEIESSDYDLQHVDGSSEEFARALVINPSSSAPDITATLEPTLCTDSQAAFLAVSRDNQDRYRTLYGFGPIGQYLSDWTVFSASTPAKTFASRPACAMRDRSSGGLSRFVVVGKGTDNKLYASTGTLPQPNVPIPNPQLNTDWAAISSTVYSGSAGPASPALASKSGTGDGGMVMAFISNNGVYAHYHPLPYASGPWQARVAAPALPNGAIPVGTPAITFVERWAQVFHVVVRAQVGSQYRFYETYFGRTTNGFKFCGILCGSQSPSWTQLPITSNVGSSPALEFSPDHGETMYFINAGKMYQTSGFATQQQLGTLPVSQVFPGVGVSFDGAPGAAGGFRYEMGQHLAVARAGNNVVFLESQNDEQLMP